MANQTVGTGVVVNYDDAAISGLNNGESITIDSDVVAGTAKGGIVTTLTGV